MMTAADEVRRTLFTYPYSTQQENSNALSDEPFLESDGDRLCAIARTQFA